MRDADKTWKQTPLNCFIMSLKPILRDNTGLYGKLMQEMFHEYVASDTFHSHPREEREELVGAYEEINALIANAIEEERENIMANSVQA